MRPTKAVATAVTMALVAVLTACGSDGDGTEGGAEPVTVEVTFADNDVTPKGERVEVAVGQAIEFEITADLPGGIHVHSSPEQEFEYEAGTHTYEVTIDQPGLVDVESHEPSVVIVQLEVS